MRSNSLSLTDMLMLVVSMSMGPLGLLVSYSVILHGRADAQYIKTQDFNAKIHTLEARLDGLHSKLSHVDDRLSLDIGNVTNTSMLHDQLLDFHDAHILALRNDLRAANRSVGWFLDQFKQLSDDFNRLENVVFPHLANHSLNEAVTAVATLSDDSPFDPYLKLVLMALGALFGSVAVALCLVLGFKYFNMRIFRCR